jgi:beta-lactamase class A
VRLVETALAARRQTEIINRSEGVWQFQKERLTMKKTLSAAIAAVALTLVSANYLITQDEALVSAALGELKFEAVPGKPGIVGAPPKFKVAKQTIQHLDKLHKEGAIIEVQGNGAIKIIAAKR